MSAIARLFGKSPFVILQKHMQKVFACMEKLKELFQNLDQAQQLMEEVSKLEYEADQVKNEIRNNLPLAVFLPIPKATLLEILSLQDALADKAEDIAVLLTFKQLEISEEIATLFQDFIKKSFECFEQVHLIIAETDNLLECSFGGNEATLVAQLTDKVAYKEHEADLLQRELTQKIFKLSDQMTPSTFYVWMKLIQEVASIADISEKLANRIRMTLEFK